MGWASGSELAEQLWLKVRKYLEPSERKAIARHFIESFENFDCDTICECEQLCIDAEVTWDEE